jgi:hypothetical protein
MEYPLSQRPDVKQPAEEDRRPPRVRFSGIQRVPVGAGCRIRVKLEAPAHGVEVGVADGAASLEGELRAAAEATLDALRRAAPLKDGVLSLREVTAFDAFGKASVMVSIGLEMGAQSRSLIGFSPLADDPARATVLAILGATNRLISAVLAAASGTK